MSKKGPFDADRFRNYLLGDARKPANFLEELLMAGTGRILPSVPMKRLSGTLADLVGRVAPSPPEEISNAIPSFLGPLPRLTPPPPASQPAQPAWGAEFTRNFLRRLLRRRPSVAEGRVLPQLEDMAVMEGREIQAAFVYTDLSSFSKIVSSQPTKMSFVLLQAFVELVTRITNHYGGVVVDCAGDRLLSVFHRPAKNYSEEPVHEAITAAFWIQTMLQSTASVFGEQGISSPSVGIGIDYGTATVGCVGFRNNKRLIFLGDAANNAAKLQDLARAGETVISHAAFLRKPGYMNNWIVRQEGLQVRVSAYFSQDHTPPRIKRG